MANAGTIYTAKKAAVNTNPVTNAVPFVTSQSSALAAAVYFPSVTGTTSAAFRIRARGRTTTGTSGNFAISLQFGSSVSASTNTIIYAPTTQTCADSCVWLVDAILVWDATKKQLETVGCAINGSTVNFSAYAAGTTVTAVDLSTASTSNAIVAAALFGTSNAANVAALDELSLEVL